MSLKTPFRLTDISLDEDGVYYVRYTGDVPEQGGIHWGEAEVRLHSLEEALAFIEAIFVTYGERYKEEISKRTKEYYENKDKQP